MAGSINGWLAASAYFFFPGSMALILSIRLGLAAGVDAAGFAGGAAAAGGAALAAGCAEGLAPGGVAPFSGVAGAFALPGNGVDPFTTDRKSVV